MLKLVIFLVVLVGFFVLFPVIGGVDYGQFLQFLRSFDLTAFFNNFGVLIKGIFNGLGGHPWLLALIGVGMFSTLLIFIFKRVGNS